MMTQHLIGGCNCNFVVIGKDNKALLDGEFETHNLCGPHKWTRINLESQFS